MLGLGLSAYVPYVIFLAAIPVCILSITRGPRIGLYFLVPLMPLQNVMNKVYKLPFGKDIVDIVVVAMLIGWLWMSIKSEKQFLTKTSLNKPLFLYILVTFFGMLWGSYSLGTELISHGERLMDWKNFVLLPLLYFIAVNNIENRKNIWIILIGFLLSIFLFDFFFHQQFKWVKHWHYTHEMRIGGAFTYLGPNEMGAFLAQYSVLILGLILYEKQKVRLFLLIWVFVFSVHCLTYSYSRSGYLAFLIATGFVCFIRSRKLLLIFVVFLFLLPHIVPVSVIERIESTSRSEDQRVQMQIEGSSRASSEYDSSTASRFELTEKAIELFKTNPFFGVGFLTFSRRVGMDAHNNFAKHLAELGIAGFSLYICLYFLAFHSGWRLFKGSTEGQFRGLGLGFAGCVIANMVTNTTHDCWIYFNLMGFYWICLAIVVRANLIIKMPRKSPTSANGLIDEKAQ